VLTEGALKLFRRCELGKAAVPPRAPLCPTNGFCPNVALPRADDTLEELVLAGSAKKLCRPRVASAMLPPQRLGVGC